MPGKALKRLQKYLWYSKKPVICLANSDRNVFNNDDADKISDYNIHDKIGKFANQLKWKFTYWISLQYLSDLGKIDFSVKIDLNIRCTLETEMKELF